MKRVVWVVGLVIFGVMLAASPQLSRGCCGLKQFLAYALVAEEPIFTAPGDAPYVDDSVIYVLGGNADSLRTRFMKAAELYKQGLARKIWIDRDDMLMEYSPSIGRNLSHDEWAILKLVELGVERAHIETVLIDGERWGTYSEAKTVSSLVSRRNCKSLILVSSDYHTARVWYSFTKLKGPNTDLYIYPAPEDPTAYMLFSELIKLVVYRVFL